MKVQDKLNIMNLEDHLRFSDRQKKIIEVLRENETSNYPFRLWYTGALYALGNTLNPDRLAQAAQSLRELCEKLPRVVGGVGVVNNINSSAQRKKIIKLLQKDKQRLCANKGGKGQKTLEWEGILIDDGLSQTVTTIEEYFNSFQRPSRAEQIFFLSQNTDPLSDVLTSKITEEKVNKFRKLWEILEGFAHHNEKSNEALLLETLYNLEFFILDMFELNTSEEQKYIQEIINKEEKKSDEILKVFELIKKRGANYTFFFKNINEFFWMEQLEKNGFFEPPLKNVHLWHHLQFFNKVINEDVNLVLDILQRYKNIDDISTLRMVCKLSLTIDCLKSSASLQKMILSYLKIESSFHDIEIVGEIIKKWSEDQREGLDSALKLVKFIVSFQPDTDYSTKSELYKQDKGNIRANLEPKPRFEKWSYNKFLQNYVRPLSEKYPKVVADILLKATAKMISYKRYDSESDTDEDYSHIWCRNIEFYSEGDSDSCKAGLTHTLTYACKQIYLHDPENIPWLDNELRRLKWKLFLRIRLFLYSKFPQEKNLPWIAAFILDYKKYSSHIYSYEFEKCIKSACSFFKNNLLTQSQLSSIYNEILSGPDKQKCFNTSKDGISEHDYLQYQKIFHLKQIKPFETILNDNQKQYLSLLNEELQYSFDDDAYKYFSIKSGFVVEKSPVPFGDLLSFSDVDILILLNNWKKEEDAEDFFEQTTYEGLAAVFQKFFEDVVVVDKHRFGWWMQNKEDILNPTYIAAMVKSFKKCIEREQYEFLEEQLNFCLWVIEQRNLKQISQSNLLPKDTLSSWRSSLSAVVNFLEICIDSKYSTPILARNLMFSILDNIINNTDEFLDDTQYSNLYGGDPLTTAINATRSRSVEILIKSSNWLTIHCESDTLQEIFDILDKRICDDAKIPLTYPENILLAFYFEKLNFHNKSWALSKKKYFFPMSNEKIFFKAFETALLYSRSGKDFFHIMMDEVVFVVKKLPELIKLDKNYKQLISHLGEHCFWLYLIGECSLAGKDSFLAVFYENTKDDPRIWAKLFRRVGHIVKNFKNISEQYISQVTAYVYWRLKVNNHTELVEFFYWLDIEDLDDNWRLQIYLRLLKSNIFSKNYFYDGIDSLANLANSRISLVVDCLFEIVNEGIKNKVFFNETHLIDILRKGLASSEPQTQARSKIMKEKLLAAGYSSFLNIE